MTSRDGLRCNASCLVFTLLAIVSSAIRTKSPQPRSWTHMLLAVNQPSNVQLVPEQDNWSIAGGGLRLIIFFLVMVVAIHQAVRTRHKKSYSLGQARLNRIRVGLTWVGVVACILGFALLAVSVYGSCGFFGQIVHLGKLTHTWDVKGTVSCDDGERVDLWSLTTQPVELTDEKLREVPVLPNGVPKILHQMWKENTASSQHAHWVKSWNENNPDWLHVMWTDDDLIKFMMQNFPDAVKLYKSYPMNVMRSDMARAYLLYTYGGVYADLDYESFAPLDQELSGADICFIDSPFKKNEDVQNSLMTSSAKHKLWLILFQEFKARAPKEFKQYEVLQVTGPGALSEAMRKYEAHSKSNVCRLSSDRFMFGKSADDKPAVSRHWLDDSWLADVLRVQYRTTAVITLHLSAMVLAVIIAVGFKMGAHSD